MGLNVTVSEAGRGALRGGAGPAVISRRKRETLREVAHQKCSQAELLLSSARRCCQVQAWGQSTFQG